MKITLKKCNFVRAKTNNYEAREIQHQLDKALLENEKLKVEKEKSDLEAIYWREKFEKPQ